MLLAFSRDLRVVLLRLASRLQTLRWYAATKRACPRALARSRMQVFAPLANRLGIWQIKWELEDLAFRFLAARRLPAVARLLDEKRTEREQGVEARDRRLARAAAGGRRLKAEVQGRPKHLYSIWKKMQGKGWTSTRVRRARAARHRRRRAACYAALGACTRRYRPVAGEFDDYIAKPKPNGYQSLHTVVLGDDGRPLEVQIRTRAMHEHAEHGVAAHWPTRRPARRAMPASAPAATSSSADRRGAQGRAAQLLAWERDFVEQDGGRPGAAGRVRRPHLRLHAAGHGGRAAGRRHAGRLRLRLHTDLGHRCRGARVDGVMVPLNTPLKSGQTVEIVAAKEGGPSLDWLNPNWATCRARAPKAKVRAWFNAQAQGRHHRTRPRGWSRSCCSARAARRSSSSTWPTQLGFKQRRCAVRGGRQGRVLAAQHREPAAPGRAAAPSDERGLRRAATAPARRWRAGGGVESLMTSAGALLPAGAARRHRRLRHARQGRGDPPARLQQLPPHGRALARARHRRGLGASRGRQVRDLPGGRGGRGRRPPGPAARHLRGVRQGEDERHRRAHGRLGGGPIPFRYRCKDLQAIRCCCRGPLPCPSDHLER
jgi:hypothetical protein